MLKLSSALAEPRAITRHEVRRTKAFHSASSAEPSRTSASLIARQHPLERRAGAVDLAQVGDLGDPLIFFRGHVK